MHHVVCASVCVSLFNFKCLNQSSSNSVCVSWHLNPSQPLLEKFLPLVSASVCIFLTNVARQQQAKHFPAANKYCFKRFICGLLRVESG
jgi:hypothetical protein